MIEKGKVNTPVPMEAEKSGDGANGENFEEESGEHEEHGGEEGNEGAKFGGPVPVEGNAANGDESEEQKERRLEAGVPRGGHVPQVIDPHVRHRRHAQSSASHRHHR